MVEAAVGSPCLCRAVTLGEKAIAPERSKAAFTNFSKAICRSIEKKEAPDAVMAFWVIRTRAASRSARACARKPPAQSRSVTIEFQAIFLRSWGRPHPYRQGQFAALHPLPIVETKQQDYRGVRHAEVRTRRKPEWQDLARVPKRPGDLDQPNFCWCVGALGEVHGFGFRILVFMRSREVFRDVEHRLHIGENSTNKRGDLRFSRRGRGIVPGASCQGPLAG